MIKITWAWSAWPLGQLTVEKIMKTNTSVLVLLMAFLLTSCAQQSTQKSDTDLLTSIWGEPMKPDMKKLEKHPLGSAKNPVRVSMPVGQREYLSRLICENGEPVSVFSRDGSVGIGPFGSMLDLYTVVCDTYEGAVEYKVYMDMYHPDHTETRPAAGFKALTPASDDR
jgi:hypothetical protein